ncbi:unnamed protein product [Adineta steineri]|uniref:Major facilitator superfamily (MFS) profile domain-containing protein n=1 Tax=Adineta steineri TaxID=433720 RepID=A0A813PIJ8_9BILA|nr:unnamed protein product [Adineta steineri]CAF3756987.1 unnamed protein product [Adineta steineri]
MSNDKTTATTTPRLIPSTRFTLALLVSFALFIQYAQRISISMSIVCMVDRNKYNTLSNLTSYPDETDDQTSTVPTKYGSQLLKDKKFAWSELQQQILLGSYWFGYIFTLVPSGWLAIKFGPKLVFAASLLFSSIAAVGISSIYFINDFNFYVALFFRVIIGFAHGPLFPTTYTFWSVWAVPAEKSTLTSIGFCSGSLGISVMMLTGGLLCRYVSSGWVYIFLLSALFGFIWLPLWLWLVADSPQTHRTISENERNYICEKLGLVASDKKKKTFSLSSLPWMKFIKSKPIIALLITECCNLFGLFFVYTNVGKILTEIHRVPPQYAGYILAGGFILMPISSLSAGVIADFLSKTNKMSLTNIRKLFNSLTSFIPAICMVILCFCDHTRQIFGIITVIILLIASALAYGSGYIVNFGDVIPAYSSIIFGIITAIATFTALFANVIAGVVIQRPVLEDWRKIFILFSIVYFIGGLAYIVLGSAVPRKWATLKSQEEQKVNDTISEEETVLMRELELGKK